MASDRDMRVQVLFNATDKASGPLRKLKSETARLSTELNHSYKSLAQLQRAQADLKSFKALKAGLSHSRKAMLDASAAATKLGKDIAATEKPTRKQVAEFNKAKRSAEELAQKYQAQTRQVDRLRDSLSSAGIKTRSLVQDEKKLAGQIATTNEKIGQQKKKLSDMRGTMPAVAAAQSRHEARMARVQATGGIIGTAVTTAATATGVKSVVEAAKFETSMTDIAQKAALGRAQAEALGRIVLELSPKIAQLPENTAAALDNLAGAGLDPRQGVKMLAPIGRAATAYNAEMTDLGDASFAAIDNLKVPVEQTARVLDIMAASGKAGRFEIKDMAQYFPMLTASAQALGQKGVPAVADLAAALQITRKATGDSSTAANNLQNLLTKINTEDTIKNFKEFGIDLPKAMKKAAAEGKSPIESIARLTQQATKGDLSKLSYLFGDAQVQAALRPLVQNMDLYTKIRADALKANAVVDQDFADRSQNTATKWERLKASFSRDLTTAGQGLKGKVDAGLGWLTDKLDRDYAENQAKSAGEQKQRALDARRLAIAKQGGHALKAQMNRAGGDTISGFVAGMESRSPLAYDRIRKIMSGLKKATEGFWQIRSPSRVMMTIGGHITGGLAAGIEKNAGGPLGAMQRMSGSMLGAVPGGGLLSPVGASGGSVSRSVTVNAPITIIQQPGEDAGALARRTADEMESRQRSAERGAYLDD